MIKEIKEVWAERLVKAGKKGLFFMAALKNGDNLSPDGILTDMYLEAHGLKWEKFESKETALGRSCAMPDVVLEWAGLDSYDPILPSISNLPLSVAYERIRNTPPEKQKAGTVYEQLAEAILIDL